MLTKYHVLRITNAGCPVGKLLLEQWPEDDSAIVAVLNGFLSSYLGVAGGTGNAVMQHVFAKAVEAYPARHIIGDGLGFYQIWWPAVMVERK